MAADPTRRPAAARCPAPARAPRGRLLAGLWLAAAGFAAAAAPTIEKPVESGAAVAASKRTAPAHGWFDGATWRPLTLDAGVRADFTGDASGKSVALRAAAGPLKDVPTALQSPVLRDESGRARALPGGILVVLAQPLDEPALQRLLERHAVAPPRRVNDRIWRIEAPAGLASLELANRLAASGDFAAVQPDWWVERVRK
jgi:hypothetical protein